MLINHEDASDREDIDEWDWRIMLKMMTRMTMNIALCNDELVTLLLHL